MASLARVTVGAGTTARRSLRRFAIITVRQCTVKLVHAEHGGRRSL
jgi:hypothetical protein